MKAGFSIPYLIPDPRTVTGEQLEVFARVARRADLITFCERNDRNGEFRDLDVESLRVIVRAWAREE